MNPQEWIENCAWVHPKIYPECPFCELTLARQRIYELERLLQMHQTRANCPTKKMGGDAMVNK